MLLAPVFAAFFAVLFGKLPFVFLALAINGASKNETDPYAQQMAQFQAAQYQQPQYQQPQFQPPQQPQQ